MGVIEKQDKEFGKRVRQIMNEVTFAKAQDSDLKRDNANINGNTSMGAMLQYGANTAKEFYLDTMIDPEFARLHREGYIHIHDLDFYGWTTTCTQIELRSLFKNGFNTGHGHLRQPKSIGSYAALAAIAIQSNQNDQHGGQSICDFDYAMADGVQLTYEKYVKEAEQIERDICAGIPHSPTWCMEWAQEKTRRDTYQAMEGFIHNLNTMHSRAGAQVPFSSVNFGTCTTWQGRMAIHEFLMALEAGLGNGETAIFPISIFKVKEGVNYNPGDPNYDLFKLAIRVSAKRLFPNFEFLDAPFNLQYYKPGHPETEVATMGCVHGFSVVTYRFNGDVFTESFERMFDRVRCELGDPEWNGRTEFYADPEGLEIYDSYIHGFTKVKTLLRNAEQEEWRRVSYGHDRVLICTPDHPLPVVGYGRTFVDDILDGDLAPVTNETVENGLIDDLREDDPDMHWRAGVILCDAAITGGRVVVSLGMDERDVAEKLIKTQIHGDGHIKEQHRGAKGEYLDVTCGNAEDARMYQQVFGGDIKINRHIPDFVMHGSRITRLSFLAGMMDADGYVTRKADRNFVWCEIGSVNRELALQQLYLIQSLGYAAKMHSNLYNRRDRRLTIEFEATDELAQYMASVKKRERILNHPHRVFHCNINCELFVDEAPEYAGSWSYDVETESDHFDVNGINSHNCRTRVMGNVYDPTREICSRRGNLSFTSINLPRLAIEADHDIGKFRRSLDAMMMNVLYQLLDRFEVQRKRYVRNFPFLMGEGVWLDSEKLGPDDQLGDILKHGTLSIGFIGLAEALVALIGHHHGESEEAQKLGLDIIGQMRAFCDKWSKELTMNITCLATPAEGLSGYFIRKDKERFGIIPGVTTRDYYTNSFHVPVYYPISAFDKIKIEAPYHALTNAGHITYIEMDGDPTKNLAAFEAVVRQMKEEGIGYGSINHPVDRDPDCGFNGIIGDVCPCCGRKENEHVIHETIKREVKG